MAKETKVIIYKKTSNIIEDARTIINSARSSAVRSVDFCRVQMYWNLGKRIFEEEQQGKERADYGTYLIKNLASTLESEYGSGFGVRQLEQCRQFYRIYPIANALRSQLNWTHYRLLRCFVVIELKTKKLTHEDLGQLQMYVNYFDRNEKLPDENPTIGILLCTAKNDEMVKMT
ncbi:MAG: PDDEXK nuclease domain-containing protein, partial [Treponema sp.]|nr:PDDEXK nuclease domain-containing protein [Treponema sp.]